MSGDEDAKMSTRKGSKVGRSAQLSSGVSSLTQQNGGVIPFLRLEDKFEVNKTIADIKEALMLLKGFAEADQGAREIRANHRSVTGWINGDCGAVPFESTIEMDFAYLALFDARVTGLQAQPLTIRYQDETNQPRHYTPDFLVEYVSEKDESLKALVEIKLASEIQESGDKFTTRFKAAENWCLEIGYEFHLITDEQIRTECIDNIKALYPFRFATDYQHSVLWALDAEIKSNAPISIEEVLRQHSSTPEDRAKTQKLIWILVARQSLHIDLGKPWGAKTILYSHPVWHDPSLFFTVSHEAYEV